jgi:hypothetical protein
MLKADTPLLNGLERGVRGLAIYHLHTFAPGGAQSPRSIFGNLGQGLGQVSSPLL